MIKLFKKIFCIFICLFVLFIFTGCNDNNNPEITSPSISIDQVIDENGIYNSKDEVALYLHTYNKLPKNYYTKAYMNFVKSNYTSQNKYSIGGDRFYNYEGLLPSSSSRIYFECDINYQGGNRNALRIVYSNDGLIFYTDDHYKSFTRLY